MKKLPNLIVTSGDPAGIGLDLCVMLAFKKFMANITIIGNKDAILSRARQQKKSISFSTKFGSHLGNGNLQIIDLDYKNRLGTLLLNGLSQMGQQRRYNTSWKLIEI